MSGSGKDRKSRALVVRLGYEVGYAKPPEATRFQPGLSGNPRGRPKGAKNRRPVLHEERMKEIIVHEAYRTITVRDGERNVTVPMVQAIIRALAVNAAQGPAPGAAALLGTPVGDRAVAGGTAGAVP
jgi:hypothetical protein